MTHPIATAIRYTQVHHQRVAYAGAGMYKWDTELEMWILLTPAQWDHFHHTEKRTGIYLAFSEENTTAE